MPSYRTKFPSKYLKAGDIQGTRTLTIEQTRPEPVGRGAQQEEKLLTTFTDERKGLILNKVNAAAIAKIAGTDDYDAWVGVRVAIKSTTTEMAGETVPCLRVVKPEGRRAAEPEEEAPLGDDPEWVTEPQA